MTQVKFRLAAYTDAAGRYNPDAPRNGNEDNMFVNADLGAPEGTPFFESDKETVLTEYGCLLVVADGMGGMNAGEVASEIAVNVVKEAFSKETIPHSAMEGSEGREKYLKKVVVLADEAIKKHASAHRECEGMGSTLVMAWLHGDEASLAWLGDSRIYLFREPEGLKQQSRDHSYVQELVDSGKITEEEAFIHPYNNVITRSLGDTSKKAEADSLTVKIFKGDILLLNSDGLSGVLHDDEMGQIIRENRATMSACRSALWKAAEAAGWHDNVTAVLCEVTEGEEYVVEPARDTVDPEEKPGSAAEKEKPNPDDVAPIANHVGLKPSVKWLLKGLTVLAVLAALALLALVLFHKQSGREEQDAQVEEVADSLVVESDSILFDAPDDASEGVVVKENSKKEDNKPENNKGRRTLRDLLNSAPPQPSEPKEPVDTSKVNGLPSLKSARPGLTQAHNSTVTKEQNESGDNGENEGTENTEKKTNEEGAEGQTEENQEVPR